MPPERLFSWMAFSFSLVVLLFDCLFSRDFLGFGVLVLGSSGGLLAIGLSVLGLLVMMLNSPNSGYTEGVLTVRVKAGCSLRCSLWAGGFVCVGMPF